MDPVTILATANAAFSGIKQLVQAGRDLEDCVSQLASWAGACADIDKAASIEKKKSQSIFKSLIPKNTESVQSEAMTAYMAKVKIQRQRDELRELIGVTMGKHGWEAFLREEARIRKERQDTVHAELERREKVKQLFIAIGLVLLALGTLGLALALILAIKEAR